MQMINLDVFLDRFEKFKRIDYANNFYNFWRYKVDIERKGGHILDKDHFSITHDKLGPTLRKWQAYRSPRALDTEVWMRRLKTSLEEISSTYDHIRKFNLLNFQEAPRDNLQFIWHKLGRVKEYNGEEKFISSYYVVSVTKPLMFLWGQTIAFDEVVRGKMPQSRYYGTEKNRWTFTLWYNVMREFQQRVLKQPKFIDLCKDISRREFGTEDFIPFGQFIDLYYWVKDKN